MSEKFNDGRFPFARSNLHILPSGNIWALYSRAKESPTRIGMLGPDGRMKREGVVKGLESATSLRVDSRGNIYVATGFKPDGRPYPPEIAAFARRLREKGTTARGYHSEAVEDTYGEGCGSVLKFGPEGGEIREADQAEPGETRLTSYP